MKHSQLKFLIATGLAAGIALAGISPAAAAPVNASISTVKPFVAPSVTINTLVNSTAANTTAKRLLKPSYKVGKGATLISTRLTVHTAAGRVITPSATSVNVLPGSYRVTTTIRYTYKQSGRTVTKTISKAQNLVIGVAKPAPASSPSADIFNRFNALRVKKGLPALKNNSTFNGLITAWERNPGTAVNPMKMPGLKRVDGPSIYGGSSAGLPQWVVSDLMAQAWFPSKLYSRDVNTLSVTTQVVGGRKEVHVTFAYIS